MTEAVFDFPEINRRTDLAGRSVADLRAELDRTEVEMFLLEGGWKAL